MKTSVDLETSTKRQQMEVRAIKDVNMVSTSK